MNPLLQILNRIGQGILLLGGTLRYLPGVWSQRGRVLDQLYFIGYATLPLVAILSFFIGAVLALQIGYASLAYGATELIGGVVGLSIVRELGPVMTAVMLAGRVGSAVTAELASMKVYQEVDALRTMNIPPERFLVLPRFVAAVLTMPVLTMTAIVAGWIGGQVVAAWVPWLDQSAQIYYQSLRASVELKDLTDGLIKAEVFAIFIITICCVTGLETKGGPREIGASVTLAVVSCIIFILLLDYGVTSLQL